MTEKYFRASSRFNRIRRFVDSPKKKFSGNVIRVGASVTRWLNYLFNIGPLTTIKIAQYQMWFREETLVLKDLGSNPSTGWTFVTLICCKNCNVCKRKTNPTRRNFKNQNYLLNRPETLQVIRPRGQFRS